MVNDFIVYCIIYYIQRFCAKLGKCATCTIFLLKNNVHLV